MACKYLHTLLLLFVVQIAFAQEQKKFTAPDYRKLAIITKDKSGGAYYPKLLARYRKNDTTLTPRDIHVLYYGSFFNDENTVSTFSKLGYQDSIKAIHQKDSLSQTDRKNLIRYYQADLKDNPYSLRTLNALLNLYSQTNDRNAAYCLFKLRKIGDVIMASGDGMSVESGFHVNAISDEYALLGMLGFEETGNQQLVDNKCDFVELKPNKYELPGLYFNVEQMIAIFEKGVKKPSAKLPKVK